MIRKLIIILLTIATVGLATIGILSGSGYSTWGQRIWSSGNFATTGYQCLNLHWGGDFRVVMFTHSEVLDRYAVPSKFKYPGPGLYYVRAVVRINDTGLYARSTILIISYIVPILLAVVCSSYPIIVLFRGPLRRHRRRRHGMCLKCGYNLTGNESGVCPECGTTIKRPSKQEP